MNEPDAPNLRREARFPRQEAIHIQIVSAGAGGRTAAEVMHCRTEDISATGFKVLSDAPIEAGRILELLIEVEGQAKRYLLVAEARWCRPEGAGYASGFELLDADHGDLGPWRVLFEADA
ncbi:MAG: PilZ domain-containing protein [Gammaproteobacteria bacterium]|nr:PilZ domain-containing protein [Gammaproteobacteria bacterium]